MTIIENISRYLADCPYIGQLQRICVDYLAEGEESYSVEAVPAQTVVQSYIDGSSTRQFVFVFAARLHYSDELRNNIDNSGLYEHFADWLEEQTETDHLPELPAGKTATKIEAMSSGYLFDISGDLSNARYQIQCRLIYDQEKGEAYA